MKALLDEVPRHRAAARSGRAVINQSAVQDSKGNVVIERKLEVDRGPDSRCEASIGAETWCEDRTGACGDGLDD
jgi:hypothetical protein